MKAGLAPDQFWDMTPRELDGYYKGRIWQEERRQGEIVSLAWYIAALGRVRRLPTLRSLLAGRRPKKLTPEELAIRKAEIEDLSKRMGKGLKYAGEK